MKKSILLFFTLFLSFLTIHAQQWLWGREGYGSLKSVGNGESVATDKTGNAFLTGSTDPIMIFGSDTITSSNDAAYLIKYNSAGNVIWSTQLTDSTAQTGSNSVATDITGNIYITGYFYANAWAGAIQLINPHSNNPSTFLIKYNANGNLIWAKWSNTSPSNRYAYAYGNSVASDKSGNVFITGEYYDTTFFGAYRLTTSITSNANSFIAKYDSNGNVLWAKQSNANKIAEATSVTVDKSGCSYITGLFSDSVSFGITTLSSPNKAACFLVKYSPGGAVLWAKQSISPSVNTNACIGYAVVTDAAGNPYITGFFSDTVNFGSHTLYSTQLNSMFLTKYDTSGNVLWAKQSSLNWQGMSLASDAFNHIYMSGNSDGNPHLFSVGTYSLTTAPSASFASFIAEFDTSGQMMCGSIVNNVGEPGSRKNGIASDSAGKYLYTAGWFDTTIFCGPDTLLSHGAGADIFLGRWKSCCAGVAINDNVSSVNSTCFGNNGKAFVSASGGTGNLSYVWAPFGSTKDSVAGLSAGTYTITITDSGGCSKTASVTVNNTGGITASVCCNSTITSGQSVPITVTTAKTYSWYPSTGLSCDTCQNPLASPTVTTWYYVTVTDSNGCSARDSVLITVKENCGSLFIPDAFSPNGDGQNDILYVRDNCINTMDFVIYDRWGNKVFESENQGIGWDGTYEGKPMTAGAYVWYLKALFQDGTVADKKGSVALVR
jgi:gliding motility-associated-like protein